MNFQEGPRIKCVSVIKFKNNTQFVMDSDSIKREITSEFDNIEDINRFEGQGSIVDIATGQKFLENFTLSFKGFFRQSVEGSILVSGQTVKDFLKYDRLKPYLLVFYYDKLQEKL